jgi:hypothetical protein
MSKAQIISGLQAGLKALKACWKIVPDSAEVEKGVSGTAFCLGVLKTRRSLSSSRAARRSRRYGDGPNPEGNRSAFPKSPAWARGHRSGAIRRRNQKGAR